MRPTTAKISLGYSPPQIRPAMFPLDGCRFLSSGYHHVYRLMKAGFSHVPCIVREASTFAQTGAYGPGLFSDEVLMVPRPPLFPDFADPVLGIISPFRAVQRVIRIRPDEYFVYR